MAWNIFGSGTTKCLNAVGILDIFTTNGSRSIIPATSTWLTGLCSASECTNASLAFLVQQVYPNCSADLSGASIDTVTNLVQEFYPSVRQMLCAEEYVIPLIPLIPINCILTLNRRGSTNCINQTLSAMQSTFGSIDSPNKLVSDLTSSLPSNITCTDCNKAIYNLINQASPSVASKLNTTVAQCGANFTGKTLSNVSIKIQRELTYPGS